jgi:hypothetical protein
MKTILRLIILAVIVAVTLKYLQESDIHITAEAKKLYNHSKSIWMEIMEVQPSVYEYKDADTSSIGNSVPEIKPASNLYGEAKPSAHNPKEISPPSYSSDERVATAPATSERASSEVRQSSITSRVTYSSGGSSEIREDELKRDISELAGLNARDWIKAATRLFSGDSWKLLMLYDALPEHIRVPLTNGGELTTSRPAPVFHYLKKNTRLELLREMSTNVHEIGHGFAGHAAHDYARRNGIALRMDDVSMLLYMDPYRMHFLLFPREKLFPSRELARNIPAERRTFRFELYINGNNSTQAHGIFGLLEELWAYYIGSRYKYQMLPAFQIEIENPGDALFEWVRYSQSSLGAFYEFDFFIREYLLHMKTRYPANYESLAACSSFREAYKAVRTEFALLEQKYMETLQREMDRLNITTPGCCYIEDNELWIKRNNRSLSGTPVISEDKDVLLPVLRSSRYEAIREFFL